MKITFNLEQHGSRAAFWSTLMMPWKQTIRMKDDRTVQSVLTSGPLCPGSCYCPANRFIYFFQGPLFGVSKKTSSEGKDPWVWSWESIQKFHHISCQRKGVWKKSKFSRIMDGRTHFVDVGLMMKTMKRVMRHIKRKKNSWRCWQKKVIFL